MLSLYSLGVLLSLLLDFFNKNSIPYALDFPYNKCVSIPKFTIVCSLKFLTYINDKFPNQLNHLIIGFVIGTLSIVWPWNQIKNNIEPIELSNSLNSIAIVLILIGILITVIINSYVDKENLRVDR